MTYHHGYGQHAHCPACGGEMAWLPQHQSFYCPHCQGQPARTLQQPAGVTVYTTPSCQYCHAAKNLLRQYGVQYTEVDVSSNTHAAQEMINKSGQMGTPVIDINGAIIVGYDPNSILTTLQRNGYIR